MFNVENLTFNGGTLAPGGVATLDIPIPAKWVKIAYIKIVQLVAGIMVIDFDIWESSTYNPGLRDTFYLRRLRRNISQTPAQGGEYGEALSPMVPYKDRDPIDEEKTYCLHCRLRNDLTGTASDFAVVITLADIGEGA